MTATPRLPEIGDSIRLCGKLVEIQDVKPPVTQVLDYVFEETSATVWAKANGQLLKEFATFNDFYGSARTPAIVEAKKIAATYGDAIEVVVIEKRQLIRKRPTNRENFYAKEFVEFETLNHGCRWDLPGDVEEQVWSSKDSAE